MRHDIAWEELELSFDDLAWLAPDRGFQECSPISMSVDVIEYRNGNATALRSVVIQLQNEDHTQVVMTWKLLRARIVKHTSGPLNGKGTDVAMEELTLAYERLELE